MTVDEIEAFVNKLRALAGDKETSPALRDAISRCRLAISMYRMSPSKENDVHIWFNQVWLQSYDFYKVHEKSYKKSPLFNYLYTVFVNGI